jgi:hypothetical protein
MLSYKLWQRHGGDRSIVGGTIEGYDPFFQRRSATRRLCKQ